MPDPWTRFAAVHSFSGLTWCCWTRKFAAISALTYPVTPPAYTRCYGRTSFTGSKRRGGTCPGLTDRSQDRWISTTSRPPSGRLRRRRRGAHDSGRVSRCCRDPTSIRCSRSGAARPRSGHVTRSIASIRSNGRLRPVYPRKGNDNARLPARPHETPGARARTNAVFRVFSSRDGTYPRAA